MGKKEKDGLLDTIRFGNGFGLFEDADKLKERYRAFAGWRTIMEGHGKTGHLAFLPDRNCAYGMNSDIKKIEKFLKKQVRKIEKFAFSVGPASMYQCHFGEYFGNESIEGVASPRASHGYLYIQIGILK